MKKHSRIGYMKNTLKRYVNDWEKNLDIGGTEKFRNKINLNIKDSDVDCDLNKGILPFKDDEFNTVISRHTLEHIKTPLLIIDEVYRILKKNGIFILCLPNFSDMMSKIYFLITSENIRLSSKMSEMQTGHISFLPKKHIKRYCQSLGFCIIEEFEYQGVIPILRIHAKNIPLFNRSYCLIMIK
jgi:SAM-dependent methyltransferase